MFNLEFVSEPIEKEGWTAVEGRITLGDHWETFIAPIDYWPIDRYERQWHDAATRLLAGHSPTAFFTGMADRRDSDYGRWWPAWREGKLVHVTEQLLFFDQLEPPFDESDPYKSIGVRHTISEDGEPISFWTVLLSDIEAFAGRSRGVAG